ncbi:uncharacterized protein LOC110622114 [Manihot esculenta]|uniref:Uncharacterized protein n=4 Tax=Manihot esculenta TaxID=3983 RepID=A0ACB7H8A6_MANES|nr:uncharacterized protein LOC110622114 [Manihot esculenta]XP_021622202.2 uncharacterized protein LOC110622114 [Manihot esculenta]XP_021622203.2 uncharacterized protein LOC110622114 [Manihot esculenta]KAG8647124.1 hypothetical protein MANES_09G061200v8 [Manihot esculenta]KAG8647125.1 hypothetical protein MANES_09G061200v8 [Manihot esculenta]KAG8647126.1 hypothetical protein MANES_09G061200v8 [Manihot esculenta]
MEHNGLPGGIFSGMGSGMLGLEMPLQQQQQQNPQNPQNSPHLHHPQMLGYGQHESDNHHPQSQQAMKHGYPYASSTARQKPQSTVSDEDEPGFNGDDTTDGKRKVSPWQRMKWTDSMVRLLIMAVFYIGDEAGPEGNDPTGKKKAGGLSQKKGKWKSVSRAMMEKGFFVSPQQCEDKFNDLNKRYKRVNDILGKGTACKVVENQSLLETMDLSPKMKEEVKKLLNSKHLFFREMCAYHNSCGHGSSGVATDQSNPQHPQASSHAQQQRCSHSSETAQFMTHSRTETEGSKMAKRVSNEEDDEEDDDESEEDEDDSDDEVDEAIEGNSRGHQNCDHGHEDEDDHEEKGSKKRQRTEVFSLSSAMMQQLNSDLVSVIQDGAKSTWEKKHWMKLRLMQLEEQQVSYQCQAFELEKQRLKWVKFSSKKEREMERAKLENERRRLESERMVLLIRQKELELLDLHQQQQISSNKRSDPSSITG